MARAKKKKQTLSQTLVGFAALGLPGPVRQLLARPVISFLAAMGLFVAIATGLVFVNWEDGVPHLSINEEKAAEAKQRAAARIEEFREGHPESSAEGLGKTWSKLVSETGPRAGQPENLVEKVEATFGQHSSGEASGSWKLFSNPAQPETPVQHSGPVSQLLHPFESRR